MKCRLCGCDILETVLDLGDMALTGIFPKPGEPVEKAPLHLVRCTGECGLVQLADEMDLTRMYGDDYGYRSGLNPSMVRHLHSLVNSILRITALAPDDLIIDIGSNDGTTLKSYPEDLRRLGIDPTIKKFAKFYPGSSMIIPEFFSAAAVRKVIGKEKAKVITTFACFYDLTNPVVFAKDVKSLLTDDGFWVMEMSYLPAMMKANAFDTICHEHLEYYCLRQIEWIAEETGFTVCDIQETNTNGGSFVAILTHEGKGEASSAVLGMRQKEITANLNHPEPYKAFSHRTNGTIAALSSFLNEAHKDGKKIYGLGASTKGNVLLQLLPTLDIRIIEKIGDINPDKHGHVTPETNIPIVSEEEALVGNPDYFFVLPWHFKDSFVHNPKFSGRTLVFPLPELEIVIAP